MTTPSGAHESTGEPAATTDTCTEVASRWARLLKVSTVRPDDNFFSLGGTSIMLVEFAHAVEATYGVALPLEELFPEDFTAATVGEAIDRRRQRSDGGASTGGEDRVTYG